MLLVGCTSGFSALPFWGKECTKGSILLFWPRGRTKSAQTPSNGAERGERFVSWRDTTLAMEYRHLFPWFVFSGALDGWKGRFQMRPLF